MQFPGPEVGYTDLIDAVLDARKSTFNAFPLRPSASNKCNKALIYDTRQYHKKELGIDGYPRRSMPPEVKRLLSLGHSVEWHSIRNFELISNATDDYKIKYKQQSIPLFKLPAIGPIKYPRVVEGSLDLAVMSRKGGGGFGDVKSAKDKWSQSFKTKWDETIDELHRMESTTSISESAVWVEDLPSFLGELKDMFFIDNFIQLNIYCTSQFAKDHSINHGFIYRYNKNDSRHLEVRFKPHDGLARDFEKKVRYIYETAFNISDKELAEMPCTWAPGSIKYAFCDCHSYSGRDPKVALQKWFDTFPKRRWPLSEKKLEKKAQELFAKYEAGLKQVEKHASIEAELCDLLSSKKINKVKLDNGHVYELKSFKTGGKGGGPRTALRRSKL